MDKFYEGFIPLIFIMKVKKGDKIKVEYTGTFDDETVFDSSQHGDHSHPLEFEVGSKQVIKGFDDAVIGMELNEEKTIKLSPENAYGKRDEGKIMRIPRSKLPAEHEPKVGMILGMQTQDGRTVHVKISKVDESEVTVDLNHPLAGKNLNFKVKIIQIN